MIAWFSENWLSLVVGLIVAAIAGVCLLNIIPRKGKPPCAGCGKSCAGCAGCGGPGNK